MQLVVLVMGSTSAISRFGDGLYSLVSFLFAVLLTVSPPRAKPFVKVGPCAPRPMESALLLYHNAECGCWMLQHAVQFQF